MALLFRRRDSLVCSLLVVMIPLAACGGKPADDTRGEPAEVPTIVAETATVARRTLTDELVVRGAIVPLPNQDVRISALVAGRIDTLSIAEGDTVRAGQVIATLDRRSLEEPRRLAAAGVQLATAQLDNARLNLQRMDQMFARGIAAGKEVEDARTSVATAEAAVEEATANLNTANLHLERTDVRSPIAGQVVKRLVSVGEQVDGTAGQPIAEVANLDQVELAGNVPAAQIAVVTVGQKAIVSSDAFPSHSFAGAVVAIAPSIDPATNTVLARVRVANTGRSLKAGMFAVARLELARHAGALVVPPSALVRNGEGAVVYVVSGDTAQRTPVTVGIEKSDGVEILSGVTEGQIVLTSAVYGLGDKAKLSK